VLFLALIYERRFFEPAEKAINPLLDVLTIAASVIGELALTSLRAVVERTTGRPPSAVVRFGEPGDRGGSP
jgi:hypothetical protein